MGDSSGSTIFETARSVVTAATEKAAATQFQERLAREMLLSQRLRTTILACLFSVAAAFFFLADAVSYFEPNPDLARAPALVQLIVFGMALYEFAMRWFINRQIARQSDVPTGLGYVNAFIEISLLTLVIIIARDVFAHPLYALSIPAVIAYSLFIVLSTLYLDFKLSLFTGGIAAAEYLAVALYTVATATADPVLDPFFMTPFVYSAKALLLFLSGAGAAFVAIELYRRMMNSFAAIEERNKEKQASAFKSKFLANMSHEIRTPLNAILGHAQLMNTDPNLTAQQRHALETIAASGNHLLAVINDVLDLAKIEAGREDMHIAAFDLAALVGELSAVFEVQCRNKGLTLHVEADVAAGPILGDETKLRQVLTNLLGNAVKFTDTGGVTLFVRTYPPAHYFFDVRDTGPGISQTEKNAIFNPFHQEAQGLIKGGTGLGLAIAFRHVDMMGGRLDAAAVEPHGARFFFTVSLPSAAHPEAQVPVTEPLSAFQDVAALAPGQDVNAMVVDDVPGNREVLTAMLRRIGVRVCEASNGSEALDVFRQHKPEIVFLDMRMPGLSGPETLQRLRAIGAGDIKFVAVSASALAHERTAPWIERVGLSFVKQKIVEDAKSREALNSRFVESQKYAQIDPWAEESRPQSDNAPAYRPLATVG